MSREVPDAKWQKRLESRARTMRYLAISEPSPYAKSVDESEFSEYRKSTLTTMQNLHGAKSEEVTNMKETLEEFLAELESYPAFDMSKSGEGGRPIPLKKTTEELEAWKARAAAHGFEIMAEKESDSPFHQIEPCWVFLGAFPSTPEAKERVREIQEKQLSELQPRQPLL